MELSSQPTRFLLDENVPVVIADQLKRRGIEAITVKDLEKLGGDDLPLLEYAAVEGYVICSFDADYINLPKLGIEHAGVVFIPSKRREVGTVVKRLLDLAQNQTADRMKNMLVYL